MVDTLTVPAGLEAALGAALGEELTSAADRRRAASLAGAARLRSCPALPGGATALGGVVQGQPALTRALSQIGLIEGDAAATHGRPRCRPVRRSCPARRRLALGRLHDPRRHAHPATVRLQQRNRLARCARGWPSGRAKPQSPVPTATGPRARSAPRPPPSRRARQARRDAEHRLERGRAAHAQLRAQAAAIETRLSGLEEQLQRVAGERAEAEAAVARTPRRARPCRTYRVASRGRSHRLTLSALRARETVARTERDTIAREHEGRAGGGGRSRRNAPTGEPAPKKRQGAWRIRLPPRPRRRSNMPCSRPRLSRSRAAGRKRTTCWRVPRRSIAGARGLNGSDRVAERAQRADRTAQATSRPRARPRCGRKAMRRRRTMPGA